MTTRTRALWVVLSAAACGDSSATSVSVSGSTSTTGSETTDTTPTASSTGDSPTDSAGATGTSSDASPSTDASMSTSSDASTTVVTTIEASTSTTTRGDESTTTAASTTDASTGLADTTTDDAATTDEPLGPFAVDHLAAGVGHACAILHGGGLKCWGGYTEAGNLGLGDPLPRGTTPGTMGNDLPFVDLGAGHTAMATSSYYHACVILEDSSLKCWGDATFGALGSGSGDNLGDGPGEMGDDLLPIDLGTGRIATQVETAVWTTCAVLDDATAKCWGWNGNGWLGQGDKLDRGDQPGELGDALPAINLGTGRSVKSITIDNAHACAHLDDDSVKCWGQHSEGSLGNGQPGITAVGDQPGEMGDALPTLDFGRGRTVKQLTVGARHGCVLLDDDSLKCWGANSYGQLGLGDIDHRGDAPGELGDKLPVVDLGTGRTAVLVRASYFHTCAILDDDSLKCWGMGSFGANGQGETQNRGDAPGEMGDALPPIDLGTGRHAIDVAPGALYNCALLDDHSIKCWGIGGTQGALGYEDMDNRGDQPGEMGDALPTIDLGA